jgi:hypothetical protein
VVALVLVPAAPFASAMASALPACLVKSAFGLPCPACGGTRALAALLRLDIPAALHANPLACLGITGFILGGFVAGALALSGRPLAEPARYPVWLRVALVCLVAANWAWLVVDGR